MSTDLENVRAFWDSHPCNSGLSQEQDRREYFSQIERERYRWEWHIPLVARFDKFPDRDVLEIGCGIGIDGLQFARRGARYIGVDLSPVSIETASERFRLAGANGRFVLANAEQLPFRSERFDHVYSFGVIHHSPDPRAIVREMRRVLRPGGTFCIMLYNKSSINYYVEIMFLRKVFRQLLRPRFMPRLLARITGLDQPKLSQHRSILLARSRLSKQEWISINTDGPECPLSRVYSKRDVFQLFEGFSDVKTEVCHYDTRHWPFLGPVLPKPLVAALGRRWGWHRMVYGMKGD